MSDLEAPKQPTIQEALSWPIVVDNADGAKYPQAFIGEVRSLQSITEDDFMSAPAGDLINKDYILEERILPETEDKSHHPAKATLLRFPNGNEVLVVWRRQLKPWTGK